MTTLLTVLIVLLVLGFFSTAFMIHSIIKYMDASHEQKYGRTYRAMKKELEYLENLEKE